MSKLSQFHPNFERKFNIISDGKKYVKFQEKLQNINRNGPTRSSSGQKLMLI